jgi:hypothetical protein
MTHSIPTINFVFDKESRDKLFSDGKSYEAFRKESLLNIMKSLTKLNANFMITISSIKDNDK